jgi:hypothetical protein
MRSPRGVDAVWVGLDELGRDCGELDAVCAGAEATGVVSFGF